MIFDHGLMAVRGKESIDKESAHGAEHLLGEIINFLVLNYW